MDAEESISGHLPTASGVSRASDAFVGERIPVERADISASTKLADMTEQYGFYHPGLLYSLVPLNGRDPFVDFAAERNHGSLAPLSFTFDLQVVIGFERYTHNPAIEGWNYVLHALEKPVLQEYLEWVGSASFIDRSQKALWRVRHKELSVVDSRSLLAPDPATWPRVPVHFLCLDTSRGCWYFDPAGSLGIPTIAYSKQVFDDTRRMTDAVLADAENPLAGLPDISGNGEADNE